MSRHTTEGDKVKKRKRKNKQKKKTKQNANVNYCALHTTFGSVFVSHLETEKLRHRRVGDPLPRAPEPLYPEPAHLQGVHLQLCIPGRMSASHLHPAPASHLLPKYPRLPLLLRHSWTGEVCRQDVGVSEGGRYGSGAAWQGEENLQILVGTEEDSFPLMEIHACETEASEQWDYVLVADCRTQRNPTQVYWQQQFLDKLKEKGLHSKVIKDQKQVFFGIRAGNHIFDLYGTLLMEPEGPGFNVEPAMPILIPATTRIRILDFVLRKTVVAGVTFEDLVKEGVFEARFPLHKGEAELEKWARWRSMFHKQPIDQIRNYFGEKVALYFAWLGWYTYMLVPAALVGIVVFLSGFSLFEASQISKEICEAHDIFMCPLGDHGRKFQRLSDTCTFAKLTHLFDNDGTVLFAIFMALWATVFLEIWKRQRARVVLHWDLYGWDEDQEEMALELINCKNYKLKLHQHSYLRSGVILALSLLMICLMIGMAHVLVVYRVLAAALFSSWALPFLEEQVTTAVVVTGALVHYVTIVFMTKINKFVALKLCDFEKPRTFSERESRFTIRFFTLQFFAHFSSLIYIAFILGRINGHPGKSTRLAGVWKLEECHVSGCMMDLFVQMAIIMGLKQTLSNCMEYLGPWLAHRWRSLPSLASGRVTQDPELRNWQRNYRLNPVNTFSLFDEFMEMKWVSPPSSDPVRLHHHLRSCLPSGPTASALQQPCRDPPGCHQDGAAAAASGASKGQGHSCLTDYVNHSLSTFDTKHFQDPVGIEGSENVTKCRYRDYRNGPPDYNFSEKFWFLLAIRLAFVILFEHIALCIKLIAAWFVPDVPQSVKNKVLQQKYDVLEQKYWRLREKMWNERMGWVGVGQAPPSCGSTRSTEV
ncbi:anoctamin-9 isoform X3 [Nycticebus coucang]|uniref:anoctamin-9 isoform X3 n=1 Tax=Nycticebus coucang TaxID=9470 RepID=UPI00234C0DA6|nr:anoctamin-9 isoform X3 [Nycticebus coucang]